MANVLCVMAHPDDESLACGGTLARYAAAGDAVHVLTFTDGVGSRPAGSASTRRREYFAALKMLGAQFVNPFSQQASDEYPDQRLETVPLPVLASEVSHAIQQTGATTVITHWPHDLNADHRRIAEAVLVATRPCAGSAVRRVLAGEVPESTGQSFGAPAFAPTVFVALDWKALGDKLAGVRCYASEAREWPHPRNVRAVEARAEMWGGLVGVHAAEAFCLLREVV